MTTQPTQNAAVETAPTKGLANDIAFGLRQTVVCFATDFIDPVVGTWIQNNKKLQKKFTSRRPGEEVAHQPWYGEVAGDTLAFFTFLGTKRLLAKPLERLYSTVERVMDRRLTKLARTQLLREGNDSPHYEQKLTALKHRHAQEAVDSLIIATESTAANVLTQRYVFDSPNHVMLILISKLVGAVATVAAMFGLGRVMPTTMQTMDDEIADRYAAPLIRGTQKLFGVTAEKQAAVPAKRSNAAIAHPLQHSPLANRPLGASKYDQLLRDTVAQAQRDGLQHAAPEQWNAWKAVQQKRWDAVATIMAPDGALSATFSETFRQAILRLVPKYYDASMAAASAQSILNNRRDDAAAASRLFAGDAFIAQIHAMTEGRAPLPIKDPNTRLEKDVAQLMQDGEPAVHIYGTAYGQYVVHKALVECFDPAGSLQQTMLSEMKHALPRDNTQELSGFVASYIAARRASAIAVVDDMKPHGRASELAVVRAEQKRLNISDKTQESKVERLEKQRNDARGMHGLAA